MCTIKEKGGTKMNQTEIKNKYEKKEVETVIQAFRLLSSEEQRIAYAVLEGMHLQRHLEEQQKLIADCV